ncbi:DNA-binding protein SMUBP-2 [Toxocara canis]|uniref:DNA-binding protein SMUBP-2 n=1 Tax=Toxocara canis TaxID=6265 RepID=A0A0B2W048_TOXCA|nr:DNA-binding protein SMUBP-2 [Toxocara canis]
MLGYYGLHSGFFRHAVHLQNLSRFSSKTIRQLRREHLVDSSWNELCQRGLAIGNLHLVSHTVEPLCGRVIELETREAESTTSARFKRGVPLVLCGGEQIAHIGECVLLNASERRFRLKLEGQAPELNVGGHASYTLIPSVTAGVLHSLTKFISELSSWKGLPGERILQYAYRAVSMPVAHHDRKLQYVQKLNDDQKRAVAAAMNKNRPIVTIQGPPGTGKTAVVIEIILQAIRAKQKNESRRLTGDSSTTRKISQEASRLRDSMRKSVISEKQVILCTVSSGSLHMLRRFGFFPDVVVIDEAAQAMECATWVPVLQAPRCILAGDHCQLPAVLHSNEALSQGLGTSLMETLYKEFGSIVNQFLSVQHRMNENIMRQVELLRKTLGEEIVNTVDGFQGQEREVIVMSLVRNNYNGRIGFLSEGRRLNVAVTRARRQFVLVGSAKMMQHAEHLRTLLDCITRTGKVLSPEQLTFLPMNDHLTAEDVSARERRRLNVAVTRARRQFVLVGSAKMMQHAEHLRTLLDCITRTGKVLSPEQLTFLPMNDHLTAEDVSAR